MKVRDRENVPIEDVEEKYKPSKNPHREEKEKQERQFPGEKGKHSVDEPVESWDNEEEEVELSMAGRSESGQTHQNPIEIDDQCALEPKNVQPPAILRISRACFFGGAREDQGRLLGKR